MKTLLLTAFAAIFGAYAHTVSAQQQVRFTGMTTADAQLIHDVIQPIARYIRGNLKCSNIQLIEAQRLSEADITDKSLVPAEVSSATHELWTFTFCDRKQSFQIAFWPAKEGGMMFGIGIRAGK